MAVVRELALYPQACAKTGMYKTGKDRRYIDTGIDYQVFGHDADVRVYLADTVVMDWASKLGMVQPSPESEVDELQAKIADLERIIRDRDRTLEAVAGLMPVVEYEATIETRKKQAVARYKRLVDEANANVKGYKTVDRGNE